MNIAIREECSGDEVAIDQAFPRFGFRSASTLGISCEWEVPEEAFMIATLDAARMRGVTGTGMARYRKEFSTVT